MRVKIIFIICLASLLLISIRIDANEEADLAYNSIIQSYEEYIKLEEEVFKNLVFTLSKFQIKGGETLKLILEDQLGRRWIFKVGEKEKFYSRVAYLLYKLFAINTPEVHYKTFNINGKFILGNIQRFIPNQGTLERVELSELPQNCLDYLLKTHILYWLIFNIDAGRKHFLVISDNKDKEIMRVDLRIWWFMPFFEKMSKMLLRYDYSPLPGSQCADNCYCLLWKDYISNKILLPLSENYEFVIFIFDFPDEFFKQLLSMRYKDLSKEINIIMKRKRNLPRDFKAFYTSLLKKRGEVIKFSKRVNYPKISKLICNELRSEMSRLKDEKAQLKNKSKHQEEIRAIFSYDAYKLVNKVYCAYWREKIDPESLSQLYDEVLEELDNFYSISTNSLEKKAISYYIDEIELIKSTGRPSYGWWEINKLIDAVPKD